MGLILDATGGMMYGVMTSAMYGYISDESFKLSSLVGMDLGPVPVVMMCH